MLVISWYKSSQNSFQVDRGKKTFARFYHGWIDVGECERMSERACVRASVCVCECASVWERREKEDVCLLIFCGCDRRERDCFCIH